MWITNAFPFFTLDGNASKKFAKWENNIEFQNNFFNILNLALNRVHFNGFPDTCNERYFKLSLILSGKALLAKDAEFGFLTLYTANGGAQYNIYGEVPKVYGYGWNGFMRTYTNYMYGSDNSSAEALVCRDNYPCYPMINYIMLYAERLTSTMRTIDTTARKLKTPYFIVCEETQKSSVKKILNDIDFNQDSIITNKSTTPDMFQILPTNVREGALDTLWNHYNNLDANLRSLIGIKSAVNQDKKERLLVDEVNSNDQVTGLNIAYRMNEYELFCETANELFGLNLSVEYEDGEDYVFQGLPEEGELSDTAGDSDSAV